ncbi:acetyl-CoA synthetase-like protein, partial [Lentithecium fluviatile CBS 122367]
VLREADFFGDRNRVQVEKWNSEPLERVARTIHDVIEETTSRAPHEQAVCSWDGSLTYQELREHASRVAGHLIELDVRAEVVVPLCFDKSKWNVVAMLSVLQAGACFLPLDPAAPKERLQHLLHAVDAKVLLCS